MNQRSVTTRWTSPSGSAELPIWRAITLTAKPGSTRPGTCGLLRGQHLGSILISRARTVVARASRRGVVRVPLGLVGGLPGTDDLDATAVHFVGRGEQRHVELLGQQQR